MTRPASLALLLAIVVGFLPLPELLAQAARKKEAAPAASANPPAIYRSAIAFGFGGKVGPKEEGFVAGYESYRLRFGPGDWAGARVIITAAWGDGTDKDLWNWPDGSNVKCSDTLSDKDGSYVVYSLATAHQSGWVAAIFRVTLRDGRQAVANALIPYQGKPDIPAESVDVLGFGGKLGPRDAGYVPEFDSYRFFLGPGNWSGATINRDSTWGEGSGGGDTWGWGGGAETKVSEVRRDAQGSSFVYSIKSTGHSRWLTSLFRFARKDGRPGIALALYPQTGAPSPPGPAGQPTGFPVAAPSPSNRPPRPTARSLAAAQLTPADLNYFQSLSEKFRQMDGERLAGLDTLQLTDQPIDDAGAVHLRGFRGLDRLVLQKTLIGDAGLENIAALTNLRKLDLSFDPITDAGLEVVGRLGNLTELNIGRTLVGDVGMRSLRRLMKLEYLGLSATDVGDNGIATLRELPELRILNVAREEGYENEKITAAGLAQFKTYPKLDSLILYGHRFGDEGLKALKNAKFTKLDLQKTDVGDADVTQLDALPRLQQLRLEQTGITGLGVANLKTLPRLKSLYLGFSDIGDAGLAGAVGLKNLEILAITKGKVTDAGMVHVRKLRGLTSLVLPDNLVTGAGLANVRGLNRLVELNLYYNKLDNASLAVLETLPELQNLYISGDQIDDAGLPHIARIPKLRYVNISWTKVTRAGIDDLKKALPELIVSYGDY